MIRWNSGSTSPDSSEEVEFDELLWSLRRGGLKIPVSSAIDAFAAIREVGLDDRRALAEALAAVLVKSKDDRRRFDRVFEDFFRRRSPHETFPCQTIIARCSVSW